jgi:hypothetical protein
MELWPLAMTIGSVPGLDEGAEFFVYASWWALAMTFGSIPGICFIGYCFFCGRDDKKLSLVGFVRLLVRIHRIKNEGLEDTGRLLAGDHARLFAIIVGLILFCIATDRVMLIAINVCAVPAGVVCHRQAHTNRESALSRKESSHHTGQKFVIDDIEEWMILAVVMPIWIGCTAVVLVCAHWLGFWEMQ